MRYLVRRRRVETATNMQPNNALRIANNVTMLEFCEPVPGKLLVADTASEDLMVGVYVAFAV